MALTTEVETKNLPQGYGQKLAKVRRSLPRARLTGSEIAALGHLGRFPMMTVEQLAKVSGWSASHISTTLGDLQEKGMLDCGFVPRPLTSEQKRLRRPPNKPESIYRLTNVGVSRGQREGVIPETVKAPPARWHGDFIGSYSDIGHRRLIVDVMIAIERAVENDERLTLGFLKPDFITEKRGNERVRQTKDSVSKSESITPDLIAKLFNEETGRSTLLFVEVQNSRLPAVSGNPDQQSITKKLRQYSRYFENSARRFKHADQSLVLYVANETIISADGHPVDYVEHIHRLIAWNEIGSARGLCLLSSFERMRSEIFGPAWLNHRGEPVRLVS